jgi:hypothetical protein
MEIEEAKEIVISLANGINPITGKVFPDDSPYNDPTIIRSLFTVANNVKLPKKHRMQTVEETQARNLANGKPKNAGLSWTEELKQEVAQLFGQGRSINELARHFERTDGSIRSELKHQGLVE